MPLVAGLLGERSARLLAVLLVVHSLKVATSAVSLSVDKPQFPAGGVGIVDSAKYPLLAIVSCSGGRPDVHVNEIVVAGNGSLEVQLEENSIKRSEFFILPNNAGTVLTEGEYQIEVVCYDESKVSEAAVILVSILTSSFAAETNQPYFTDTPRYINISASTPPGTVIATYKAEFPAPVGEQPATQQYVVHDDFLSAPFQLDSSSGELTVNQSLQKEDTPSMYDIVVVADQGQCKAWTVTTITIESLKEFEETPHSTGSGISGQANKIILTIIAILSVWAGNILL